MAYRDIPDPAVTAGARATAYLLRALRDNLRAADYYEQAIADQLDGSIGHVHGTGTTAFESLFSDRIVVTAGVNDRLPFRFESPSYAVANYSPTLTPGSYSFAGLVTQMLSQMRAAVDAGSPGSVPIQVAYESDPESPMRGLFGFAHTGAVEPRTFELHFGTGTGFATSVAMSIGFSRRDLKKAYAYVGTSGFIDAVIEEAFSLGQGGLLESADFVAGAFTTAKFTNNIVDNAALGASSVSGGGAGKISDGAITAAKLGDPVNVSAVNTPSGTTYTFDFALSSGAGARNPMVSLYNVTPGGCLVDEFYIIGISFSGGQWHVQVRNVAALSQGIGTSSY